VAYDMAVAIVMGSDSDLPVMRQAADFLRQMDVPFEMTVISAHRTPDRAIEFARGARERGVKVLIAGAGGAAHLPGVLAALTTLPVIGVPIDSSPLSGVDALYAIVQMPPGVPVATVGINGARNAAILAAEILAIGDEALTQRLADFRRAMADEVEAKAKAVQEQT
jgi:phosphoribosylaminoimidazole carboxylase PurE protein